MKKLGMGALGALLAVSCIAVPAFISDEDDTLPKGALDLMKEEETPVESPDTPAPGGVQDVQAVALEVAWGRMSAPEQAQACQQWRQVPDAALATFMVGSRYQFDQMLVKGFFDGKCA